jgi:arylsulfatase A-like enzyme
LSAAGYFCAGFSNNLLVGVLDNGLKRGFAHFVNYAAAGQQQNQADIGVVKRQALKMAAWLEKGFTRSKTARRLANSPLVWSLLRPLFWRDEQVKGDTAQSLADAAQLLTERSGAAANQPLFVFINLMDAHWPYNPPAWAAERFLPELRERDTAAFAKAFNNQMRQWPEVLPAPLTAEQKRILDGLYNAEVVAQDAELGRFFARLQAAGRMEQTLLIVAADHGEQLGERRLVGHDYGLHEPTIRVPLLIRDPSDRVTAGQTETGVVSLRRVFHTALDAAGAVAPEEKPLSLLQPDPAAAETVVFAEAYAPAKPYLRRQELACVAEHGYDVPHTAVYADGYKLIRAAGNRAIFHALADEPVEGEDLTRALPQQAQTLARYAELFRQQGETAVAPTTAVDDPELVERLRALGYLE